MPIIVTARVEKNTIAASFMFFSPSAAPHQVEVIIEGIRAMPVIIRKCEIFIFVLPIKYVIRSFGVPGIR